MLYFRSNLRERFQHKAAFVHRLMGQDQRGGTHHDPRPVIIDTEKKIKIDNPWSFGWSIGGSHPAKGRFQLQQRSHEL